jgi:hypothetical protein
VTLPAGIPNGSWFVTRYGSTDPVATGLKAQYDLIAPLALAVISKLVGIPLAAEALAVTDEAMYVSGRTDYVLPTWYPVRSITAATIGGTVPLTVGTEKEVVVGTKAIAPADGGPVAADGGRVIRFRCGAVPHRATLFVSYTAGITDLSGYPDLLEAFTEVAWLIGQEQKRSGMTVQKVDLLQTSFTRLVPETVRAALDGYRRVQSYV